MKKIKTVIVLIVMLVYVFCGCSQKTDVDESMDIINKNNAVIYSFIEKYVDTSVVKKSFSFEDITNMSLYYEFISINIDCGRYKSEITNLLICKIYSLLESNRKIQVNFINSDDYTFFIDTPFESGKNYYKRGNEYLRSYHNFYNEIQQTNYNFENNQEKFKRTQAIVTIYSSEITLFNEQLKP